MNPKNKIKILVDAHVFDSEYQGSRTYLREIYSVLAHKENLEIYFAAKDYANLQLDFDENTLSKIHFIPLKSTSNLKRLFIEYPRIFKKYKFDYAHFQYIIPFYKPVKYIVTTHDVLFLDFKEEFSLGYRWSRKLLFKYAVKQAEIATTVSAYSRDAIIAHFGLKKKEIRIVPNGVDNRFFKKQDEQSSKKLIENKYGVSKFILYVSRFEPRKNHHILLQSFIELGLISKGYSLVLLGHYSIENKKFDELYQQLNSKEQSHIFIHDKITNEDLYHFYNATELFVYLSKAEGFGIPPLEAGALCKPVICANTTAMADFDFFKDNHIDLSDIEQIKRKIIENLNSEGTSNQLQLIAQEIQKRYSWEESAEKFYNIINR